MIRTRILPKLSTTLVVLVYILLLIGATVRSMGAGMACPDWPTCNGQWFPPFDPLVFAEWFHRLFVVLVGIVTAVLAIGIWTSRQFRPSLGGLAIVAVLLLFVQAGLGAVTVFQSNSPATVTIHLLLGTLFFALVIWIRRKAMAITAGPVPLPPSTPKTRTFRNHILATLAMLLVQIGLGGMVSSNHAGLICPDFPTCNGVWLPTLTGLVGFQMLHRYLAYAILLIVIGVVAVARHAILSPTDRRLVRLCLAAVIVQVLLGIGLIHAKLPIPMSVAHLGVAMLLFGLFTGLAYGCLQSASAASVRGRPCGPACRQAGLPGGGGFAFPYNGTRRA